MTSIHFDTDKPASKRTGRPTNVRQK